MGIDSLAMGAAGMGTKPGDEIEITAFLTAFPEKNMVLMMVEGDNNILEWLPLLGLK